MKKILLCLILSIPIILLAQPVDEDPLKAIQEMDDSTKSEPVIATFKSSRVINMQSVENVGGGVLDFRIMHRFGEVNGGLYQLFGLDQASMRMGFEYGITDRFMIGIGRSTVGKTYDGFMKWKILQQTQGGKNNMPLTLSFFANTAITGLRYNDPKLNDNFAGRMSYTYQLICGRKFNERISLQVAPTYIHRNMVDRIIDQNDVFAIGAGGRYKLTRSLAINADYFYLLPGQTATDFKDQLSVGVDIETGGHVFQLHFSNSRGLVENQFIAETTGDWLKGAVNFGFNLSRVFTINQPKRKA